MTRPRTTATRRHLWIALVLAVYGPCRPAAALGALSEGPRLAAVYDTILDARFDDVESQLKRTCPPAPQEACLSFMAISLSWQILINPENRALDRPFADAAAAAIAASAAWTKREPQRSEAWFYLAGSYAPLVQWRILRGERLAAARDGKRIKEALERALQLDPSLADAHFGIGMYHYYADVAPAFAKVLRFLLMLPGGDRVAGLREMRQTREEGELLRGEADYQLHLVYLWYEHQTMQALALLERLDARYPHNPLFLRQIAEIRETYLHDHAASADAWRTLLTRATAGRTYDARTTEVRARLGLASELNAMDRATEAADQLRIVIDMKPSSPIGASARAESELRATLARASKR